MNYLDWKMEKISLTNRIIIKVFLSLLLGLLVTYVYDFFMFILAIKPSSFRDFMTFILTLFMWFGGSVILGYKEIKETW